MPAVKFLCLASVIALTMSLNAQQTTPETGPPQPVANVQSPPPSTSANRTADGVVRVSGGVMAAHILSKRNPVYPNTHAQGTVVMLAIIGPDGRVQNLSVISGPEPLQNAALDAVRHWRYQPFMLNGTAVTVETTVTINFRR